MIRLALGANVGKPAMPESGRAGVSARASSPISDARAAVPSATPEALKNWRRETRQLCSVRGSMFKSLRTDHFIQIQNHTHHPRIRRRLRRIELRVARLLADGQQLGRGGRVGAVLL